MNYRKECEKLGWKREEAISSMKAMAKDIGDGKFTDEQQGEFDALKANVVGYDQQIKNFQEMEQLDLDAPTVADDNVEAAKSDENQVKGFNSLGEQLQAVVAAAQPGARPDPRLLVGAAASGLNESVGSDGGFLVQTDFVSDLIKPVFDGGAIASRIKMVPVGAMSNGLKMNAVKQTSRADGSRWGGVQAYWESEAAAKTASKPEFRQMELNLHKLIGLCYATDELLQDASALGSVMSQAFADEFTFKVEDAIINGLGAGVPLGVLVAACTVAVAKETGQAAATIVAENIEKMYSRMDTRSLPNAVWFINQEVWPQLFQLQHAVGTGGVPVFVPAGGLSSAPFGTLLGRPIVPVEYCAALGTKGDIIFADMSQYLGIDKGGVQSAQSIHVRFVYDETTFRFVYRFDGQPIPNAALTPYKGTATTSPFITLATRS